MKVRLVKSGMQFCKKVDRADSFFAAPVPQGFVHLNTKTVLEHLKG